MILPYKNNSNNPCQNLHSIGKVVFAAAGPGDPDLITVKAANSLQMADVVLTDRLVSDVILHRYVSASAEIVYVGKECSKLLSTAQKRINDLMVHYALQGKNVVRLKGGDVSVFSNILDELETLIAHQIPYEIIPGVSSALGAAAYAGIPLTARGYATAVRFLTLYKPENISQNEWKEFASTSDTLVLYMSLANLGAIVEKFIENEISSDVHIAIAEQATTCYQNIYTCNIYDFNKELSRENFISPSLVIIGKVVALHQRFKWLQNSGHQKAYFLPVENGLQINNETTKPKKYVIGR
ncbi:MAG: uroporphyrinogen-III C-methyltransferase [Niabella sp.]|nr:MAG: uroporphyrinogen-III C-methyltransferase [Niabella sp.]